MHQLEHPEADEAGNGQGKHPGPDNAVDDAPLHRAEAAGGSHPHDAGRDDMRGGEGDAEMTAGGDDDGGRGFGGKAMHGQ